MKHKRFTIGEYALAGWEVWDGRNMSVAYFDAATEEAAQTFVDICNKRHERRVKFAQNEAELRARLLADFGKGKRFAA